MEGDQEDERRDDHGYIPKDPRPRRGRRGTLHERAGPIEPGCLRGAVEGIEGTPFAFLASPRTARILTVLAVGEALADKLPFSPDRISAPGLIGRMTSGALVGAALFAAAERRATVGAGLGLLSAAAASYPSYYLRVKIQEKLGAPNWAVGLVEDALAEGGGLLALRGQR